jgi:hypothetical protein
MNRAALPVSPEIRQNIKKQCVAKHKNTPDAPSPSPAVTCNRLPGTNPPNFS